MIQTVIDYVIPAAFSVLPPEMEDERATAMLVAIGLQESRFLHRAQIGGPARGFWQFEVGGVRGVMRHEQTADSLRGVLTSLAYPALDERSLQAALEHNDVLAAAVARLLLWTLPDDLPGRLNAADGWRQYLNGWRPGKPHEATWGGFFRTAWDKVRPDDGTRRA